MRMLAVLAVVAASVFASSAAPGSVDVAYGDQGFARLSVNSNVGVSSFTVSQDGAAVVTYAADPESGTAGVASPDGAQLIHVGLPGPGVADFGPGGELVTASAAMEQTAVRRHLPDGSLDPTFGSGGETLLPGNGFPADVAVDATGVVVGGGTLGSPAAAWVAKLDQDGDLDPDFGVAAIFSDPTALAIATDVHAVDDGYIAVVLVRDTLPEDDSVIVYHLDQSGAAELVSAFEPASGEVFAVASHELIDGSVVVAIQTTADDRDTFHLQRVLGDGTLDETFDSPPLTADEVGGPVHLAQLPTGPIVVGYNTGPEPGFQLRMVGVDGSALGELEVSAPVASMWMYGLGVVPTDGALLVVVDESPISSAEPDDLSIVKITGPGRFVDDDGNVHESDIDLLAELEITRGCDPPTNIHFCPNESVTRGQMAALIGRALGLPATTEDAFGDDAGSVFEADINRLAAAGITRGCDPPANSRFCPDDPVTRAEMAAFLHRALPGLPVIHPEAGSFSDVWDPAVDTGTPPVFFGDIEWLAQTGVTRGCNPPANTMFCPDDPVTRAQMASFLIRALQAP
ncbi:MAG TPA: S-layer homology domain-containing protein [Acidimicrobiia bacterium]|nr:S-layer homology domain-containing protein [Acidimicrobiia bacterium]